MIISKTPFRVSFFGGGTDFPEWYLSNGGSVIGSAIDKYSYLFVRKLPPFFRHKHRIVYSKIELIKKLDEIKHPAFRKILEYYKPNFGLEFLYNGDLPAKSGLGSSSSLAVNIIKSMNFFTKKFNNKNRIALEAIRFEREVMRENVGCQDQCFAAYGGFNRINFNKNGNIIVKKIDISKKNLKIFENSLLLIHTGKSRFSSQVTAETKRNISSKFKELSQLKKYVDIFENEIVKKEISIKDIGNLLGESWEYKKSLASSINNKKSNEIISYINSLGGYGCKVIGAGGGGFILVISNDLVQTRIKEKFKNHVLVKFKLNASSPNAKILMD